MIDDKKLKKLDEVREVKADSITKWIGMVGKYRL